jgi:hypothetical protein
MDDYILSTFGIPSVTNELGNDTQYIGEWTVKNKDEALRICEDNSHWLEHTYKKLGNQISLTPLYYKPEKDSLRLYINITNEGLSDLKKPFQIKLNDKSLAQGTSNTFDLKEIPRRKMITQEVVVKGGSKDGPIDVEFSFRPFSSSPASEMVIQKLTFNKYLS